MGVWRDGCSGGWDLGDGVGRPGGLAGVQTILCRLVKTGESGPSHATERPYVALSSAPRFPAERFRRRSQGRQKARV